MTTEPSNLKLVFIREFTDRDAFEAETRGYLSHVMVERDGNELYAVTFYSIARLGDDLEESAVHGRPFVADPGMIVLPEVTMAAMENAVQQLGRSAFFDYLVPIDKERLTSSSPLPWPP